MGLERPTLSPAEYLSGERFASLCDEAYWVPARAENPAVLRGRDATLIYTHADQVFGLFRVLRGLRGRFTVVTAESDHEVTAADFHARPWNVVEWFGMNATARQPGCRVLPLGLANQSCRVTLKPDFLAALPAGAEKTSWLYVNHRVETNPAVRQPVYDIFEKHRPEGWVTISRPLPAGEMGSYPADLAAHRFICCPPGNGLDTHRMWEALYAGTIPVVLRNPVTEAFADLPIVMVNDFSEVTLPFLQQRYDELSRRQFSWEKLTLSYWKREFEASRARIARVSRTALLGRWLLRKAGHRN